MTALRRMGTSHLVSAAVCRTVQGISDLSSGERSARKGDRTRLQIKAAAREIFARDGFLNSTIAEIVKEAQRSIGAFYRYKSKDELLLELAEEFRQKPLREIHLPLQPKQDPIENFEEKLGVFWQLYMEDRPIVNSALQMSMVCNQRAPSASPERTASR